MTINFQSEEHKLASALHDIHVGYEWAIKELPKIEGAEPFVLAVTSVVSPQSTALVRAAFACFGIVANILVAGDKAAEDALKLDPSFADELKALMSNYKAELAPVLKAA